MGELEESRLLKKAEAALRAPAPKHPWGRDGRLLSRAFVLLALGSLQMSALAQDTALAIKTEQIEGPACATPPVWQNLTAAAPCRDDELDQWVGDATHWRAERRLRSGLDDAEYRWPALAWTRSSFIQTQMMIEDRFFYDPAQLRYTVARYLDDLTRRYGGIDSVLVWPTYPNIGVDDRNQFDLFHDLPGGLAGIRSFVADFHAHGVKVLFPVMLWDQGTRKQAMPDAQSTVTELEAVGADGVNGDTLDGIPYTFRRASEAPARPLALEPELGPAADEMLNWNTMSWGYWDYSFVPLVSRFKWLEPRHMVHVSNRFAQDHNDDLQLAFFNGTGFESWENVWGVWNGLTPRDAETLRRVSLIERFGKVFLASQNWRPFAPTQQYGVFASAWPEQGATLWTMINRNHYQVSGRQLSMPHRDGVRYFDLWNGTELRSDAEKDQDVLSFGLESDGLGAVLATASPDPDLPALLTKTHLLSAAPLSHLSRVWLPLPQAPVPIPPTTPAAGVPPGMSLIPSSDFLFRVNGIEIEGEDREGLDVQYAGENTPRRFHDQRIHVPAFWIDTTPVTNAQFKRFMDATQYRPADDHNFLRDWAGGNVSQGWNDKPVTWVSIEDARAYAAWAGKRLAHEWEWQYAAQGADGRAYPWGDELVPANIPAPDSGRRMLPPSDVHAHPSGASPFGVLDLVGNVWQWTDEWRDAHTRAAILRGGSHYRPSGSRWYFPQAYRLSQHGKYLLMSPGIDRSGAIGFRCVMDAS